MTSIRSTTLLVLMMLPLNIPGCPCAEDPQSGVCRILYDLTGMAYGTYYEAAGVTTPSRPDATRCPTRLVCFAPDCLLAQENGDFDFFDFFAGTVEQWYGDQMDIAGGFVSCSGEYSLAFIATTPTGPSPSASAQIFQVVDYQALVPADRRADMRRVRVQAAMNGGNTLVTPDRQFGVRIDAYMGDPETFPREGDPETIPEATATYTRLASMNQETHFDDAIEAESWQPIATSLMLPEGTDFFVVLLEAFEDAQNDTQDDEFASAKVDDVWIAVDAGNGPPEARPDQFTRLQDTPARLMVLANDIDNTSRIDPATLIITRPSAVASATPNADGTVTFVPVPGFVGTSSFSYTVADVEGAVSNEAQVVVNVITPTVFTFADDFETDPAPRWQVQLLGSSNGPTGVQQTVRYEAADGNPGGYRAMTHSTDGQGTLRGVHLFEASRFVPAVQGRIVALDYTEDRRSINGRAVAARVAIFQNGQVHIAQLPAFDAQTWATESVQGLTAEDFNPVPDFSVDGDTLWFGYERANSNTNANAVQITEHGIDNWELVVFAERPAQAQAPGSRVQGGR